MLMIKRKEELGRVENGNDTYYKDWPRVSLRCQGTFRTPKPTSYNFT